MALNLFSVPIFLVVLREAIEAAIIMSVLLAFLKKTLDGPDGDATVYKSLVKQVRLLFSQFNKNSYLGLFLPNPPRLFRHLDTVSPLRTNVRARRSGWGRSSASYSAWSSVVPLSVPSTRWVRTLGSRPSTSTRESSTSWPPSSSPSSAPRSSASARCRRSGASRWPRPWTLPYVGSMAEEAVSVASQRSTPFSRSPSSPLAGKGLKALSSYPASRFPRPQRRFRFLSLSGCWPGLW
jgi:hypothetical protein